MNGGGQPEMPMKNNEPFYRNPTLLFSIGACLGAMSCFSRADYNLPMFAFFTVMWN